MQQYDAVQLYGTHVNGLLTQGENIADFGGLRIAYVALQRALGGAPQSAAMRDGHSPDRDFFFRWAMCWRANQRRESAITQMATDPHSPSAVRINVPLSNMPEFYAAFGVQPEHKLHRRPEDRLQIW